MSQYLRFNYRQLANNISNGANTPIPATPATILAASLKGGSVIVVPGANDVVKLSAAIGWQASTTVPADLFVRIFRNNTSGAGGILIFSTRVTATAVGDYNTANLVTVDDPPTTGVVENYLELSLDTGTGNLIGPLSFIGEVIRP